MTRLIHMASWGMLYAVFSFLVISFYRVLLGMKDDKVSLKLGNFRLFSFHKSDYIIFFILTFIASIRCNVGSDYYNYYVYFNSISSRYNDIKDILTDSLFSGYYILSYIVKYCTDYEYIIFTVIAIISYLCLFYMIRKESDDCEASLACYLYLGFYANSLNILKQYIAMTFLLMAYFSLRKSLFRSIFFTFVSISFHYSAFITLMIYMIIKNIEPKKVFAITIVALGIFFGLFLPNFLEVLFGLLSSAAGYVKYIDWDRNAQIRLQLAIVGMLLLYGVLVFLIMNRREDIKKLNAVRYQEITFLLVGFLINMLGLRIWIIARLSFYFYIFSIFIIPTYFKTIDLHRQVKVKRMIYSLLFIYTVFISVFLGENEYYSYSTIFDSVPMSIPDYNALYNYLK